MKFILCVLLLLLALPATATSEESIKSGKGLFAIHSFYCPKPTPQGCVLGNIKPGVSLLLLSNKKSISCSAKTLEYFESEFDSGSFPVTSIDIKKCQGFSFDLAAIINKPTPYALKIVSDFDQPDRKQYRKMDAEIRRIAPSLSSKGSEHELGLNKSNPRIFRLPLMESGTYIAVYENSITPGDQVHFLYTRNTVKLIHPAASIKAIFKLGSDWFIYYEFTCRIGCGYGGDIVVQFSKDGFREVMNDSSTST